MNRSEIINRVRDRKTPWDIVIIGGGATGVGCAVDAASRGYDVLLLERHDFGKGTSSRSTKLVHGGVRYLAQGNIPLVREALKERSILLNNAPHIVHKQAFIVPCHSLRQKLFYGTGLKIYDLLAGKYSFGRSRILGQRETAERLPGIRTAGLSGGVLYYDGRFDDTRLLIDLVSTAYTHGAVALNYARVESLIKDAAGNVSGLNFDDAETGESFAVSAKAVINATGVFCDEIRKMADEAVEPIVTHSQGIHLVFDRKFLPSENALMIPKTSDGRVLFAIPWHDHLLVGTTDTPIDGPELEPKALESEIDFVLETAGEYLAEKPGRNDILSVFAGIRPLVKSAGTRNTASLSRGHTIEINASGLLTITGGKWTTYRRMAEDAVDKAASIARLLSMPSKTETLRIAAASPSNSAIAEAPDRLHPDLPYTAADVIGAVRDEMARTVEDVLARRTRALFLNATAAASISGNIAELMARELEKDVDWIDRQVREFNEVARNYVVS